MNDIFITKLQERLSEIEKLRCLNVDSQDFKRWHYATQLALKQADANSANSFKIIRFTPHVTIESLELESAKECYLDGLNQAEALLNAFIDTFYGTDIVNKDNISHDNNQSNQPLVNIVNNVSQKQSQSISNPINLSTYNKETQEKLKELAEEIRKPNNHGKVLPIVKWLADKSIDALIALLPSVIKFE